MYRSNINIFLVCLTCLSTHKSLVVRPPTNRSCISDIQLRCQVDALCIVTLYVLLEYSSYYHYTNERLQLNIRNRDLIIQVQYDPGSKSGGCFILLFLDTIFFFFLILNNHFLNVIQLNKHFSSQLYLRQLNNPCNVIDKYICIFNGKMCAPVVPGLHPHWCFFFN